MKKIVLDTNCLLVCISSKSVLHPVWKSYLNNKYNLCISNEIMSEYEEILSRRASHIMSENLIKVITNRKNTILVNPYYRFNLISGDPDDNKFVDCAISANADYIISNDRHFDVLKITAFPKVNVIRIEDFAKNLTALLK